VHLESEDAFVFAGAHNIPMYVAGIPLETEVGYQETKNDVSGIHHFYHKLLKLGEYMNTETAREMAKVKTDFMKDFTNEFLKEWEADY